MAKIVITTLFEKMLTAHAHKPTFFNPGNLVLHIMYDTITHFSCRLDTALQFQLIDTVRFGLAISLTFNHRAFVATTADTHTVNDVTLKET